jgi:uncharacterized protein with HEPN domain
MSEREWRFYLIDMLNFSENILTYTNSFDQHTFTLTGLNYDATIRNLELVSEAATHIPIEIRDSYPSVAWRQIIATRNPSANQTEQSPSIIPITNAHGDAFTHPT